MPPNHLTFIFTALTFLVTLLGGVIPFLNRWHMRKQSFYTGEALASGIFLGAGLLHMLPQATEAFTERKLVYPWAIFMMAVTFLLLLLLEHIYHDKQPCSSKKHASFAWLALLMLSIHSFFAGAALGTRGSDSQVLLIGFAIIAHKWSESFSLAIQLSQSAINTKRVMFLFLMFSLMVPLGVWFGTAVQHWQHASLLPAVLTAQSAGTFLYFSTLHGLDRAVMIDRCCNLKEFMWLIIGFSLMAIVGIWV